MTSSPSVSWRDVVSTSVRLLTFRARQSELIELGSKHLLFGLLTTWLVGVGRYWDNPRVGWLQHLGLGSVVYVFALSLLLWLIIWPLRPKHWSYLRVATFVSLVSPPAILYAIPVEKFFSLQTSNSINAWFLAIVALWRVALLIYVLRVVAELNAGRVIVGSLLPLTLIVVSLSVLNLEKAVFALMGGFAQRTPNDEAFATLQILSLLSVLLFLPLALFYLVLILTTHLTNHRDYNE